METRTKYPADDVMQTLKKIRDGWEFVFNPDDGSMKIRAHEFDGDDMLEDVDCESLDELMRLEWLEVGERCVILAGDARYHLDRWLKEQERNKRKGAR